MKANRELEAQARQFVNAVVEINRRYGNSVEMTPDEYERTVQQATAPFLKLRAKTGANPEGQQPPQ